MHWGHIHFHRDQGMTLALMGKKIWNSLIFLNHINKVNLKKKENHKTLIIQHNLTYILFGLFWLWCLVKWILLYDVVCCPTFSKKFSFNAGATRVDFNIHPHGNPRHSWKKIGTLLLLFEAQ
jgi:hypothetical protein